MEKQAFKEGAEPCQPFDEAFRNAVSQRLGREIDPTLSGLGSVYEIQVTSELDERDLDLLTFYVERIDDILGGLNDYQSKLRRIRAKYSKLIDSTIEHGGAQNGEGS